MSGPPPRLKRHVDPRETHTEVSPDDLRFWSQLLISVAVALLGLLPLLEGYLVTQNEAHSSLQQRYFQLRRSIDQTTTVWELSRLFSSHQSTLARLGADGDAISQNWEQYRYTISAAEGFVFNAAYGFAESDEEKAANDQEAQRREQEGREIESIRQAYHRYGMRAVERGSEFMREIQRLDRIINRTRLVQMVLTVSALILNVVGLAMSMRAGQA